MQATAELAQQLEDVSVAGEPIEQDATGGQGVIKGQRSETSCHAGSLSILGGCQQSDTERDVLAAFGSSWRAVAGPVGRTYRRARLAER
jgi:hypothetical protein